MNTLSEVKARDAGWSLGPSNQYYYTGPVSYVDGPEHPAVILADRRWLIAEVERLVAERDQYLAKIHYVMEVLNPEGDACPIEHAARRVMKYIARLEAERAAIDAALGAKP